MVFDFETCGELRYKNGMLDASVIYPCEVACVVIEPRKLQIIPGSEFVSDMRPPPGIVFNQTALAVNKKKEADIMAAKSDTMTVWCQFCEHLKRFRKGKILPIPAGKKIRAFDLPIVQWLCEKTGYVDSYGTQKIFDPVELVDLHDMLFHWHEDQVDMPNFKMDSVRPFYGLTDKGAHTALKDVEDTAKLIIYHLHTYRRLYPKMKFKGALAR